MNVKTALVGLAVVALATTVVAAGPAEDEFKKIEQHMKTTLTTMCQQAKEGDYKDHVGSKLRVTECSDAVNHALHEIMSRVRKFKDDPNPMALFDDLRENILAKWKGRYNVEDEENGSLYLQVFILHQNPKYREEMDRLLTAKGMKVDQVPGDVVPPKFTVYHEGDDEAEAVLSKEDSGEDLIRNPKRLDEEL